MFDTETPFDLLEPSVGEPEVDPVGDPLLADLEWLPTGVMLAVALDGVDRSRLSGFDRVALLKARARQIAHDQAELLADIQSVSESVSELANDPDPDEWLVFETTASEVSAALMLTRRASEVQTELAETLWKGLPQVWKALSEGLIDLPRAKVLADQTCHLPMELAREVSDTILAEGPGTTGQLRARLQRLIISIDPDAAKKRYEERLKESRVTVEATDAGTANLCGWDLPPADANAAMRRINRKAKRPKAKGDRRPIDQIRAEVYLDILNGRDHELGSDRGVVDMRVDLTTLLGLDDQPGEIPGWGPVIADVARQVVDRSQGSEWAARDQRRWPTHRRGHQQTPANQSATSSCRSPTSPMCLPHLPDTLPRLRLRPRKPLVGNPPHPHPRLRTALPLPPPAETSPVEARPNPPRRLPVDQPTRPHLHRRTRPTLTGRRPGGA